MTPNERANYRRRAARPACPSGPPQRSQKGKVEVNAETSILAPDLRRAFPQGGANLRNGGASTPEYPQWKTRDQGTLIATAWKSGLQRHPTLPIEFNFIADYYHPRLQYLGGFAFRIQGAERIIRPCFLHVYHHFGDQSWALWQDVQALDESQGKASGEVLPFSRF